LSCTNGLANVGEGPAGFDTTIGFSERDALENFIMFVPERTVVDPAFPERVRAIFFRLYPLISDKNPTTTPADFNFF
jgi:hypothetical protein